MSDRELLMHLGAAIANFRVAAAHFGFETTVAYEPAATISVRETGAPDLQLATLFPAIRKLHTNREPYDEQPIEPVALQAVCDVIDANPGTLQVILPRDKERVAECVERAEQTLTRSASMLLLVTADDDPVELVKAGETLELLLLTITRCGLQYSFLSAPVETGETRELLHLLIGGFHEPQLLLGVGSAA